MGEFDTKNQNETLADLHTKSKELRSQLRATIDQTIADDKALGEAMQRSSDNRTAEGLRADDRPADADFRQSRDRLRANIRNLLGNFRLPRD